MNGDSSECLMLNPDDFEDTMNLLRNQFINRNPLCMASREHIENTYKETLLTNVKKCLASGVSPGVRDKKTKMLVGFFLNTEYNLEDTPSEPSTNMEELPTVFRVLMLLSPSPEVFREMKVNRVLEMSILCVHEDYGGQGLGSRLMEKSLQLGMEQGYEAAYVQTTNSISEKMFTRLGFQTVKTLDLNTLTDKLNLDTSLIPGETVFKVMIKKLSSKNSQSS